MWTPMLAFSGQAAINCTQRPGRDRPKMVSSAFFLLFSSGRHSIAPWRGNMFHVADWSRSSMVHFPISRLRDPSLRCGSKNQIAFILGWILPPRFKLKGEESGRLVKGCYSTFHRWDWSNELHVNGSSILPWGNNSESERSSAAIAWFKLSRPLEAVFLELIFVDRRHDLLLPSATVAKWKIIHCKEGAARAVH